jgi:hypothetical protein
MLPGNILSENKERNREPYKNVNLVLEYKYLNSLLTDAEE